MAKEKTEVTIPDDKIAVVCCGYSEDGVKTQCYKIFAFDRTMIKNKMEEHVPLGFKCPKCGYINCITKLVNDPKGLGNIKVKDYLECVAYTGHLNKDAIDEINDGSKKLYVDIYGNTWSRDEYKEQKNSDPALHILRKIQADEIIDHFKEKDTTIARDKVPAICCGLKKAVNSVMRLVNTPNGIRNIKTENYLECIAYTGLLSKDPIGVINDGSKKLYVDIDGKQWSRDEYKEKYGRDPALHILERIELQRIDDMIDHDIDSRRGM
jgi:predicted ATP-grasp superfamily ATP-dependent carboligase